MRITVLSLLIVISAGLLAKDESVFAMPPGIELDKVGRLGFCASSVGFRLVAAPGWSHTCRNSSLEKVQAFSTRLDQTISGTIPEWKMTVTQKVERLAPEKVMYRFFAEAPADQAFTAAFMEVRLSSMLSRFTLDGRDFSLPRTMAKASLFSGKAESFSLMTLDGYRVAFEGWNGRIHVQDSRFFHENWFEVRLPIRIEKAADKILFTSSFSITSSREAPTGAANYVWPEGVPKFSSPVFTENADWARLDFNRVTVPGSPLDFSFLADAPAGKYGFLKAGPDGHGVFEKAPEKRPRFYGGNFAWDSTFLEKDECDRVADELVRLGYNWVRAHQHDTCFLPDGATDSTAIDPAKLDKFDYFIAAMKRRGIYFTMDCYSSRAFLPGEEGLSHCAGRLRAMKIELGVNSAAMTNWKRFSQKLLTHVNPYTGLALKDEPAMIVLNLVNEDNKSRPEDAEMQMAVHREQLAFLRAEVGTKCLLTSLNMCSAPTYTVRRSLFDVVDLHMYFSHPATDGRKRWYPAVFSSQLEAAAPAAIWRGNFFQRLWGKPCVTTEFRHCMPNVFRSEAGPLMGAYAALQDWDALMGYGYAEGAQSFRDRNWNGNVFDTVNDPFSLFGEKISILLFRRGDVQTARGKLCVTVPADALKNPKFAGTFNLPASSLGLLCAVGSTCGEPPSGMAAVPLTELPDYAKANLPKNGVYTSDTGEISLDANRRTFRVVTPKSETLTLSQGSLEGHFLSVSEVKAPVTVSAHALDGKSLAEATSILLFHLSDTANTGEAFTDISMQRPLARGQGPMLVRRDAVRIRIGAGWTVSALLCNGRVVGTVPISADGSCQLKTDGFTGGVLAYHLTRR